MKKAISDKLTENRVLLLKNLHVIIIVQLALVIFIALAPRTPARGSVFVYPKS
jgi:hypothetical protein